MGTQVLSTSRGDAKVNMTVSTVIAASVAVADGQLVSWVGATALPQVEAFNGLGSCVDKLREAGWPETTTGVVVEAIYNVPLNTFVDTLTEDCVAVIKGSTYTHAGFSSSPVCSSQSGLWLESTAKAQ